MKILHIVPSYLPAYGYGGPIQSVHSLNKWLVKKGADVTVYTTNINGRETLDVPLGREIPVDGVKVFYFPVSFPRFWIYSRALRKALEENIKEFDMVHITSVFLAASALGACYANKSKKPYIISPRGSLMKEPLARKSNFKKWLYLNLVEKKNLAGAAAIHFTAEAEKKEYLAAGLPLKSSFIIPNGIELDEFGGKSAPKFSREKFGISPDRKIILSLGRLNWKKGFDTLIPAFKRVLAEEPKAILVIAGGDEDNYEKQIRGFIAKNDLKNGKDVVFTGMLADGEKTAAFGDSSVFVLPSYSENFGMAAMEGAYGTAVVITPEVGISPYVEKYGAGMVIEKDEKKFAEAILKVLKNPDLKKQFKAKGREMIQKEFSMDKVAEAMLAEYNKILKN
ncbi:MAG: glycosyltransferase [Patescibacteria group bacterium]